MKNIFISGAIVMLFLVAAPVSSVRAAEANPAYEVAAQSLVKTMVESNELGAGSWPWSDPENWPEGTVAWSGDSPRRLISLNLEDWPVVGPVDVSPLTRLEALTIHFSQVKVETPCLLTVGPNPHLKILKIHGEDGQVQGGPVQTVLRLDGLPALEDLLLGNYGVRTLDLSHNRELRRLEISINFNLTTLDLSANAGLEELELGYCSLKSLDLSHNPALKSVFLEAGRFEELNIGGNLLPAMDRFIVESCRMPLSGLSALAEAIAGKLLVGNQRRVFFSKKVFSTVEEAVLDLSSEAVINGTATDFRILDDELDIADASSYSLENGVLKFKRRGRYVVAMCNRAVTSDADCDAFLRIKNFNRGHLPGLFTGHIEVGDVSDQKEITPSIC